MVSSHRFSSPEGNKTYTNYLIVKELKKRFCNVYHFKIFIATFFLLLSKKNISKLKEAWWR
jgi:hypothetical protein